MMEINIDIVMDKHIVSRDEVMPALDVMLIAMKNRCRGPEHMRIRMPDGTMTKTFNTDAGSAMGLVVSIAVGGK
jgi:hypothetical protein